jgi:hypothetical protein
VNNWSAGCSRSGCRVCAKREGCDPQHQLTVRRDTNGPRSAHRPACDSRTRVHQGHARSVDRESRGRDARAGHQVNALSPQRRRHATLVGNEWFPQIYFEPLDTMAEAALAPPPAIPTRSLAALRSASTCSPTRPPGLRPSRRGLADGWQPPTFRRSSPPDAEGVKRLRRRQGRDQTSAELSCSMERCPTTARCARRDRERAPYPTRSPAAGVRARCCRQERWDAVSST